MEKSKGNTSHKRLSATIILFLVLTLTILSTNIVAAAEFDNVLRYEQDDMKVVVKNWFGLTTLGTAELKSHTSVNEVVRYGYGAEETVMYYDFEGWELYEDGLGDVIFTNQTSGKVIEKDYYFVEWVSYQVEITDYDKSCTGLTLEQANKCTPNIIGTHMETRWRWERLQTKDITNSRIGIKTFVDKDDYIDAIWTIAGKKIGKHAVWTAGLNVDLNNYYKLDESANPVVDSVGNINATASGTAPTVFGIINGAQVFERVNNDIITADSNLGIIGTASRSISVWVNKSADGTTQRIAGYGGACAEVELFGMFFGAGNLIEVGHYGGEDWATGTTVTADLTWHHIVLTYDGTNDYVFLDGAYIDSKSVTISTTDGAFTIGGLSTCLSGNRMDGSIDEVGIWSRNLSGSEVSDLYNGGVGISFTTDFTIAPVITLNDPTNNTVFLTNNISFNCTGSDNQNLVNVSFILDGVVNQTNTPANDTLTNFGKTLSTTEHNWTCRAADNESGVTTADTRFIDINISVDTELITPGNNQNFTSGTDINFTINSTPLNQDLVSVNMTVWFSNGTVALTNSSDLSGSVEVQTNLTSTLQEAPYIWGAETIGTLTANVTGNQTFEVHMTPLIVIINEPTGLLGVIESNTFDLSWNIEEDGQNLSTHVTNCSFTYNGVQTYLPNISVCVETNSTTFAYVTGVNSLVFTAEDAFGFVTNETTTWDVAITLNQQTFDTTSYETELNNFTANITYNESRWSSITANLIYNSTTNPATQVGTGNTINFTETIARLFSPPNVKPFHWNFRLTNVTGTFDLNTTSQNQTEQPILFINCNATAETRYLNISFKDEGNLSILNASIPTATLIHTLGNFDVSKTLTYINNTENTTFAFCLDPPNRTLHVSSTFQYTSGGYQQRVIESNDTFTNSVTDTILFLLANADGLFVTFQVINIAEQPLADVLINVSRIIDGVNTIVGTGLTNDAGAKTFWLNPNFLHTILAFKTGFSQFSTSLFPDQTSYTINLGGGAIPEEQDYTKGITTDVFPKGSLLDNDTTIVFNLTLVSTFWDVTQFGFVLKDASDNVFDVQTDSSNGGTVTTNLNTLSNTSIIMEYFWVIEGNFTNATRSWIVFDDTTDDSWSIKVFFTDLLAFVDDGMFGLDNFGLALITFLTIFIFTGIVSLRFGISSPSAVVTLLFSLVLFFDVGLGLMENLNPIGAVPFFPTILMGLILTGVLLKDGIR